MVSPSGKRWVAKTVGSRRPPAISFEQLGRRVRVDEAGRDQHVADPELLEMQRHRMAVDADVRNPAARPDQLGAQLERLRDADRLDGDIRAEPVGQLHDPSDRILGAVVHHDVGPEVECLRQPGVGKVDGDDPARRVQLRRHDRREPDRPGADDDDRVARLHAAVEDSTSYAVGRMSARKSTCSSDSPSGIL